MSVTTPYQFDEFFASGLEQRVSPFIKPGSRGWGRNIPLKASLFSGLLLMAAACLSWFHLYLPVCHLLLAIITFCVGVPKLIDTLDDLLSLHINIDALMTIAAFSAILLGSPLEGALLLVLFAISGSMEEAVTSKAKGGLFALKGIAPSQACILGDDGHIFERHTADVAVGTTIVVRANAVVPLDAKVIEGTSQVDLRHLTGEALPIAKKPGDTIPAGATNLDGTLVCTVTHPASESTVAKIIALITEASNARPKFQRFIDRISDRYAVSIIIASGLIAVSLPLLSTIEMLGTGGSVYRALSFLIAASPCALLLAMPICYLSAIGACSRRGILLKGGISLDQLSKCRLFCFDKTGTLTTGDLALAGCERIKGDLPVDQAWSIAYALEQKATHPIARAIEKEARARQITPAPLSDFSQVSGMGVEAKLIGGLRVAIGRPDWIGITPATESITAVLEVGSSAFVFTFTDQVRPSMKGLIDELHSLSLDSLILSGDIQPNVVKVADALGIPTTYSNLLPADKLAHVSQLSMHQGLAMIGDGVNDAPALTRATCGISMGKVGSRVAIDASDIVLLQDDLSNLGWLIRKARQTNQIVTQNLVVAALAMICASSLALVGCIPLWMAVIAHEGGTVLVGLNGLRLLKR